MDCIDTFRERLTEMPATLTKKTKSTKTSKRKTTRSSSRSGRPKASAPTPPNSQKELLPRLALEDFVPAPTNHKGIPDTHTGSIRYAWIGAGQCGGRLVRSLYTLGYRKALAVNTTAHDLALLELPDRHKFVMDIGSKGAGKDMTRGNEAVTRHRQQVLHHAEQIFGQDIDHIMICFGAGGGTGSGSAVGLIDLARNYIRHTRAMNPAKGVGVMMTLPTTGEAKSPLIAHNAYKVAAELADMAARGLISPLIIIDNAKISDMYPNLTVREFWPTINSTVTSLFDIFNRLSALPSRYTSFDQADYYSVVTAGGCCIMGLTQVTEFKDKFSLSAGVKDNLEKTLLADGFDLKTSQVAGAIAVGGSNLMKTIPGLQDNIDYAFDTLADITGDATIHRGIYEDGRNTLRVYTIIGGLNAPEARMNFLRA